METGLANNVFLLGTICFCFLRKHLAQDGFSDVDGTRLARMEQAWKHDPVAFTHGNQFVVIMLWSLACCCVMCVMIRDMTHVVIMLWSLACCCMYHVLLLW